MKKSTILLLVATILVSNALTQESSVDTNSVSGGAIDPRRVSWDWSIYSLPAGSARTADQNFSAIVAGKSEPGNETNRPFSDAAELVAAVLRNAGYTEQAWFPVRERMYAKTNEIGPVKRTDGDITGMAVFTRLEQFTSDGHPASETNQLRWNQTEIPAAGSFSEMLKRVLDGAPNGHYRCFCLALMPLQGPSVSRSSAVQQVARVPASVGKESYLGQLDDDLAKFRIHGDRTPRLASQLQADKVTLTIIVYEFERSSVSGKTTFVSDSSRGIDFHIRGSGLAPLFNHGR